eukprot:jgi/Chrpa1/26966/Chrysochromulina_OHIO_Genome00027733-RA
MPAMFGAFSGAVPRSEYFFRSTDRAHNEPQGGPTALPVVLLAAMDSLKSAGEKAVHSVTGMFLLVLAKVSNVVLAKVSNVPSELNRSTDYAHDKPHFDPTVPSFARRAAMYTFVLLAPLPAGIKMLAIVGSNLYTVDAVCPHCKDTILPAGHLAAACPLIVELTKNAEIFETKKLGSSPTVAHSMTHELAMQFTRPVVDAIVGLACAPVQGVQIDFTDATYNQASAVVKAAVYGHCS